MPPFLTKTVSFLSPKLFVVIYPNFSSLALFPCAHTLFEVCRPFFRCCQSFRRPVFSRSPLISLFHVNFTYLLPPLGEWHPLSKCHPGRVGVYATEDNIIALCVIFWPLAKKYFEKKWKTKHYITTPLDFRQCVAAGAVAGTEELWDSRRAGRIARRYVC